MNRKLEVINLQGTPNFEDGSGFLANHSITLLKDGDSLKTKMSEFVVEQRIPPLNSVKILNSLLINSVQIPGDDVESNKAIDDSSFDRSSLSLYRVEDECQEEHEENEPSEALDPFVKLGDVDESMHTDNLVDVLAAAKRGDLPINEVLRNNF